VHHQFYAVVIIMLQFSTLDQIKNFECLAKIEIKVTSNLSKAHVTRDSSGPAIWAIVYSM